MLKKSLVLSAFLIGFTTPEVSMAKDRYGAYGEAVEFYSDLIGGSEATVFCNLACQQNMCRLSQFQNACQANCKNFVSKDTYTTCLKQKSISIPPLHIATTAAKGAMVGSIAAWWMPFGAGPLLLSDILTSGKSAPKIFGLLGVPFIPVGFIVGGILGGAIGIIPATIEGGVVTFCTTFCTRNSCWRNPKRLNFCKDVCSGGREFYIKKCLKAE